MNGRLVPLLVVSMVFLGLLGVTVPLLVGNQAARAADRLHAAQDSTSPAAAGAVDPFRAHRFEKIIESPQGVLYGIARDEGLLVSYDHGASWVSRNDGLPQKLVYPFDRPSPRELSSVAFDPVRPGRIAVTTPRGLHVSENNGQTWTTIPTDRPDARLESWPAASDHFTSVAFDPTTPEGFLLGTSFGGFYATLDAGRSWLDPSRQAEFLRRGAGLYEEVAGIAWLPPESPGSPGPTGLTEPSGVPFDPVRYGPWLQDMIVGEGFGGKIHLWNPGTMVHWDLGFPGSELGEHIQSIYVESRDGGSDVMVSTDEWLWSFDPEESRWTRQARSLIAEQPVAVPDEAKRARLLKAANKTGIYLNALQAASRHIDRNLDFVKRNGMNSVVVDCKEDFGLVTYDTRLQLPIRMGAVKVRFELDELIRKAHARGIYVIARVLVFKDRVVYGYDNYAHAVWDREKNAPWADLRSYEDEETGETGYYQREHWTDPFDPFVVDYNISIAQELESRGVDEIQFDYIRFPTDGNLLVATYRHRRAGMSNVDALESFLAKAREAIAIPISTDLYGFNCWHRMGTTNGQSITVFSRYVDVISPMFYPNHFPLSFMRETPYVERAGRIYREGTARAKLLVEEHSLIRPYVQAFLLRTIAPEEKLTVPEAGELLLTQIRATLAAPSSGYTLWNASNDYYMVTTSLASLQPGR